MSGNLEVLTIRPQISRYLFFWLLSINAGALLAIWMLDLSAASRGLLSLVVFGYFLWACHSHLLRHSGLAIIQATVASDGRWRLRLRNGQEIESSLQPDCFITPWLVILNFKTDHMFGSSLLLPVDSLGHETSRRLRIHLLQQQLNHSLSAQKF